VSHLSPRVDMDKSSENASTKAPGSSYALGSTDAEHERLTRQAALLAPCTERFFREAGIGSGQRVLDIGSGVGDVAMLAAQLVGPSGEVVWESNATRARLLELGRGLLTRDCPT
jgi:protein-L-isoaspartate O-methyltransferase